MNIILLGAPGAGKGLSLIHISKAAVEKFQEVYA